MIPLVVASERGAADAYVKHFRIDAPVRFDIITAVGDAGAFEIEHIKEAFYPPVF